MAKLGGLFRHLRDQHKSLYADSRVDWIGRPFQQLFALEPESRCRGDIDPPIPEADYPRAEWRATGWAWDVQEATSPESIVLVDHQDRIRGLANLRHPSGHRAADRADWYGWVKFSRKGNRYNAYAVLDQGRSACLVAVLPRWEAGI